MVFLPIAESVSRAELLNHERNRVPHKIVGQDVGSLAQYDTLYVTKTIMYWICQSMWVTVFSKYVVLYYPNITYTSFKLLSKLCYSHNYIS